MAAEQTAMETIGCGGVFGHTVFALFASKSRIYTEHGCRLVRGTRDGAR